MPKGVKIVRKPQTFSFSDIDKQQALMRDLLKKTSSDFAHHRYSNESARIYAWHAKDWMEYCKTHNVKLDMRNVEKSLEAPVLKYLFSKFVEAEKEKKNISFYQQSCMAIKLWAKTLIKTDAQKIVSLVEKTQEKLLKLNI